MWYEDCEKLKKKKNANNNTMYHNACLIFVYDLELVTD